MHEGLVSTRLGLKGLPSLAEDVMVQRDLSLLGPADRMAVLAFDGARIHVLADWTGDKKILQAALAQARQRPALGAEMLAHQRKLQADVNKVLALPDMKARLAALGFEAKGGTSEQFAQYIRDEMTKYEKIIKDAKIRVE